MSTFNEAPSSTLTIMRTFRRLCISILNVPELSFLYNMSLVTLVSFLVLVCAPEVEKYRNTWKDSYAAVRK